MAVSTSERAEVLKKLQPGQALVTLDWAQKLNEMFSREKQEQYYGKAGLSYHVAHSITNINGELKSHTTVHMCGENVEQVSNFAQLIAERTEMKIVATLFTEWCHHCSSDQRHPPRAARPRD